MYSLKFGFGEGGQKSLHYWLTFSSDLYLVLMRYLLICYNNLSLELGRCIMNI